MPPPSLTRRGLMGASAAGLMAPGAPGVALAAPDKAPAGNTTLRDIGLQINGRPYQLAIEPRVTLLDALRDRLQLTGTKKGCGHGACGACTVHIDGERVLSCLTLAVRCENRTITTIEGLAPEGLASEGLAPAGDGGAPGNLHPMQASFLHHDAFQCGYCTPGQIMSAVACVKEGHAGSENEIREWMSGNLCRCGAYPNIVAAVQDAAAKAG